MWTLWSSTAALAGEVDLDGARWKALQPPEVPAAAPAPGPLVRGRDVRLETVDDGLRIEARWTLDAAESGWFEGALIDAGVHLESVTWNGRDADVATVDGKVRVVGQVTGRTEVVLRAVIPGDPARTALPLNLLAAPRGSVRWDGDGVASVTSSEPVVKVGGEFWTGASALSVQMRPDTPTAAKQDLVLATAAVGLSVGDAEAQGQARLVWTVRQGKLDTVRFRVSGVGSDLQVTGANLRRWSRGGDVVTVELQESASAQISLLATWSAAVPAGSETSLVVPSAEPMDVFRVERSLQVSRDGDLEVIPDAAGWEAVAASQLPEWGEGLVQGTPVGAFTTSASGSAPRVRLLRLELVEQPPVMVDVAQHTVVLTAHGRTLTRTLLEVRNERASHLRVVPPPGATFLGARVSGETAFPVVDAQEGWLLPLERSVETVEGLLSFTVEVILLGDEADWSKKEERSIPLPRVDASVAATRTTVHLPPGYESRLEEGEGTYVEAFSEGEGLTYGFGVGDVGAAQADDLYNQAVDAWMSNRFEEAQGYLDDLGGMGASNENLRRLQSNLDVVEGRADTDDIASRRVKEQARARALEDERRLSEWERKADEEEKKGNYAEAEVYYKASLEVGKKLDKLEQKESVEQKAKNVELEQRLSSLEFSASNALSVDADKDVGNYDVVLEGDELKVKRKKSAPKASSNSSGWLGSLGDGKGGGGSSSGSFGWASEPDEAEAAYEVLDDSVVAFDFEDIDVNGELRGPLYEIFGRDNEPMPPVELEPVPEKAPEPLYREQDNRDAPVTGGSAGRVGGSVEGVVGGISFSGTKTLYGASASEGIPAEEPMPSPIEPAMVEDVYDRSSPDTTGAWVDEGISGGFVTIGGADSGSDGVADDYDEDGDYGKLEVERYDSMPVSRSYESVVQKQASRGRGFSLPRPSLGMKKEAPAPMAAEAPSSAPSDAPTDQLEALPEPKVEAIAVGVVIPAGGQVLRFQELLLPADAAPSVVIRAREPRRP